MLSVIYISKWFYKEAGHGTWVEERKVVVGGVGWWGSAQDDLKKTHFL